MVCWPSMMTVEEVAKGDVGMLTDWVKVSTGEHRVLRASRALHTSPSGEELEERLQSLKGHGVDRVWVSHKMPLLVFLFPAVLPLVLVGDPTTLLLQWIG